MIRVGIVGALGYAGQELIQLLLRHPEVEIVNLSDLVEKEIPLGEVLPSFDKRTELTIRPVNVDQLIASAESVFLALPHKVSQKYVPEFYSANMLVMDLSADFRFDDVEKYEKTYGIEHERHDLIEHAVYGLPEINRKRIREAKLIAVPGCYPTSVLLALAPIISDDFVDHTSIIVDSKSGVTGAGRKPSEATHFPECNESMKAYGIAEHRHCPEIEEKLSKWAERTVRITFVPHLIPMNRGILSTIYVGLKGEVNLESISKKYRNFYHEEPFVRLCAENHYPETKNVIYSNFCDLGWKIDKAGKRLIILSAIDNLIKGAAGQAVQCFNIARGMSEKYGLL